jgi:beta-lactamase regulating signal transducer with metallopeptidase domain
MNLTLSLWTSLLGRLAAEAILLVALATAGQRFVASPRARGTLWQAVLLGVALVWGAELGGLRGQVSRWWPESQEPRRLVSRVVGEPVSDVAVTEALKMPDEPAAAVPVAKPSQPVWWPLQLWSAGVVALLLRASSLRLWLGLTASRRSRVADATLLARIENLRRRVGLRRVRVLAWPGLRSPIAFGTLRPTIALPADFTERFGAGAQDAMIAHELAHLAANDPLWLAVADGVLAVAWWHPAVWWARRQLRAASEASADEASALVPGGRVALAESLVAFGRELAAPGWTRGLGVAGDGLKSQLARRVTALLRPAGEWRAVRPARRWLARGVTLAATLTLVALPWPGTGGPAFAEILLASAASADPTRAAAEMASGTVSRTASPDGPTPARRGAPYPENGLGSDPGSSAQPSDQTLKLYEDPTFVRGKVTNRSYESVPVQQRSMEERYQLALQAVKQADLDAVPIFAKYGKDSSEAAEATARYQRAKEKAQLLKAANDSFQRLALLGKSYEPGQPKTPADGAGRNDPRAKVRETASETTNAASLFTRLYSLAKVELTGINEHFRHLLPPGETNLQVAIRMFCATNGVEMPLYEGTPPPDRKAVFYNDRTGILFVRATLEDFGLIERAIQTLNVPPGEVDGIRSGQAKQLQASEARLAELRTHYQDNHPKVAEELAMQAHIRASQRDFELNGRTAVTNAAPAGGSAPAGRQVELDVFFVEVAERGADDVGLDWIFGQSPTNNPALQSGPATNLLTEPGAPHGEGLRVDLLRTVGESAILTADQFAALRKRLESRSGVDFLAAPKVITLSGRQAQVAVGEEKTLVTGLQEQPATATNQAGISYQTEKVTVGPKVDIIPVLEGAEMRLGIVATVTEFLGYDQPAAAAVGKPAKAVKGVEPLPRMRVRALRADSVSKPGETVALRGPLVADTVLLKDKVPVLGDIPLLGRLFRTESRSTQRKRLYVFVTPVEITATGEKR